jgi:hypothetical protein
MIYTLQEQVEAMLKHFYHNDIDLMIKRVIENTADYTDHNGEDIIKYLKVKQRKEKILKIKNGYKGIS